MSRADYYSTKFGPARVALKAGDVLRNEVRDYAVFPVKLPSGREVWPPDGTLEVGGRADLAVGLHSGAAPSANAAVGEVGVMIASHRSKADKKSLLISVRTC